MATQAKMPLGETLTLSLQWLKYVAVRHWGLLVGFGILGYIIFFGGLIFGSLLSPPNAGDPYSIGGFFLIVFGTMALSAFAALFPVLIVHNEVLVGGAGFNRRTMGPFGLRIVGYAFDYVLMILVTLIASWILMGIAIVIIEWVSKFFPQGHSALIIATIISIFIGMILMMLRMSLRLPSRAVGAPLPWADVWRLGRGNSWRLAIGAFVLLLLPSLVF